MSRSFSYFFYIELFFNCCSSRHSRVLSKIYFCSFLLCRLHFNFLLVYLVQSLVVLVGSHLTSPLVACALATMLETSDWSRTWRFISMFLSESSAVSGLRLGLSLFAWGRALHCFPCVIRFSQDHLLKTLFLVVLLCSPGFSGIDYPAQTGLSVGIRCVSAARHSLLLWTLLSLQPTALEVTQDFSYTEVLAGKAVLYTVWKTFPSATAQSHLQMLPLSLQTQGESWSTNASPWQGLRDPLTSGSCSSDSHMGQTMASAKCHLGLWLGIEK